MVAGACRILHLGRSDVDGVLDQRLVLIGNPAFVLVIHPATLTTSKDQRGYPGCFHLASSCPEIDKFEQ